MSEQNFYRRDYTQEERELELDNEELAVQNTVAETPEEISFKKRYGDLRSHLQKKENEYKAREKELAARIAALERDSTAVPKTEEELKEWMANYPHVAGIVRTLVKKEQGDLEARLLDLQEKTERDKRQTDKERAMFELKKLHPDFYDSVDGRPPIVESKEFHEWIEDQEHQGVNQAREALYDNETNARLAAKWITLFKTETGYTNTKSKKANPMGNAASTQVRGGSSAPSNGRFTYSESQVNKMSEREYAEHYAEINKAQRNGTFNYDLTGSAR